MKSDSELRFSVNLKEPETGVYMCKNDSKIAIYISHSSSTHDTKNKKNLENALNNYRKDVKIVKIFCFGVNVKSKL